jgi:2-succinyl-6-hydroxy-2,4-cyclohexadiene-1-carboxylate synthase
MIFTTAAGFTLAYEYTPAAAEQKALLICVHGFAGSKAEWHFPFPTALPEVGVLAFDLPGFGESTDQASPTAYLPETVHQIIHEFITAFPCPSTFLLGYSMGGRYALSYALKYQETIGGLILESSSPGLRSEFERAERITNDRELARRIETEGVPAFTEYWLALPLFRTLTTLAPEMQQWLKVEKLRNRAASLSHSLLSFGTGSMQPLWEDLSNLYKPVLLLAGEEDQKFRKIQEEMAALLPNAGCSVVSSAGHNTHIEKPDEFANFVLSFIQQEIKSEFSNVR